MTDLDDYFDYAMDLDEAGRAQLMKKLQKDEPAMARQLQDALTNMVKNPDFLCQRKPSPRPAGAPDQLLASTLRVGDVARAVAWYSEHFRCRVVQQDERRATLAFGGGFLQLQRWDEERPILTIVNPDVAEIGPSQRRADGVRALQLTDPWGNAIEVIDRAPDQSAGGQ